MNFSFSNFLKSKTVLDKQGIFIHINNGTPNSSCLDLDGKYTEKLDSIFDHDIFRSSIKELKSGKISYAVKYDTTTFEIFYDRAYKINGRPNKNTSDCDYIKASFSIKDFTNDLEDIIK